VLLTHLLLTTYLGAAPTAAESVSGRVLRPDGRPASGAVVYYCRRDYERPGRSGLCSRGVTDSQGAFEFLAPAGKRRRRTVDYIVALAQGFGLDCCRVPVAGASDEAIVLKLKEEVPMAGVVRDIHGQPMAGVSVIALSVSHRSKATEEWASFDVVPQSAIDELTPKTDAKGRFQVSHIPKAPETQVALYVRHADCAAVLKFLTHQDIVRTVTIDLEPGGEICGTLKHEGTGTPGQGITVCAESRSRAMFVQEYGTSDAAGRYRISNLPPGEYSLRCLLGPDAACTATRKTKIGVVAREATNADLVLIEGGVISGAVAERGTGAPVANAGVFVYSKGGNYQACTKADGTFRLRCPPGHYRVSVVSVGQGYIRPDGQKAETVEVVRGRDTPPLKLEVAKGLTLAGRVVGPADEPVADARVRAVYSYHYPSTRSGPDGRFRLDGLKPNRSVTVTVEQAGAKLGASTTLDIGRQVGPETTIKLSPLATICGRVVDTDGSPRPGAEVMLSGHFPTVRLGMGLAHTGEDGRYEFTAVPGIEFSVQVQGQRPPEPPHTILALTGQRHDLKDMVASRPRISGHVVDKAGKPAPRARLTMRTGSRDFTTMADKRGSFRFGEFQSGTKAVTVVARNTSGTLVGQATVLPNNAGQPLTIRLTDAAVITGRVVGDQGNSLADAAVTFEATVGTSQERSYEQIKADRDGRFRFAALLPQSSGHVSAVAEGYGSTRSKGFVTRTGETLALGDLRLPRADSFIAGKVTDLDGQPLAGVSICCFEPGGRTQEGRTDANGRYRIDGVPKVSGLSAYAHLPGYYSTRHRHVVGGSEAVDFTLTPEKPREPRSAAIVGKPAPVPGIEKWLNGESLKSADLRDRVLLVHFWTLHSRPCVRSIKSLKRVHAQYPDRLTILTIHDRAASVEEVERFAKEQALRFPIGFVKSTKDDGWAGETFKAYGIESLPASFLVDKKGVLRYAHVSDDLEGKVATLVEE